jgi:hypothetical protein
MKTVKMSLENMMGKMSRKEMKAIMAGSGGCATYWCGRYQTTCCDAADWCSSSDSSGVCTRRPNR